MRSNTSLLLTAIALFCGVLAAPCASAAPGDILFSDDFNTNLNNWTVDTSGGGDALIDNKSAVSGNSLELRWNVVTVTSIDIDVSTAAGAQLSLWVQHGSDAFSEDPNTDEDLVIEYRDAGGVWNQLLMYFGGGTPGEIFMPVVQLPTAALHANLSVRFRMTGGSNVDWDYWHIDDAVVTETALNVSGFGLDSCEDFESGLGSWSVTSSGGVAGTSSQTAQSPSNSLFTRSGAVTVTSPVEDLSSQISVELSCGFGAAPMPSVKITDIGEDFAVEFLDDTGSWTQLESLCRQWYGRRDSCP